MDCPFKLNEIAVFESQYRLEIYIGTIKPLHIEFYGEDWIPKIRKATEEEKDLWYSVGTTEVIIGSLKP